MAEVTVIHSVVIRATGSTAIDIFVSSVVGVCVCGECFCAILRAGIDLMV